MVRIRSSSSAPSDLDPTATTSMDVTAKPSPKPFQGFRGFGSAAKNAPQLDEGALTGFSVDTVAKPWTDPSVRLRREISDLMQKKGRSSFSSPFLPPRKELPVFIPGQDSAMETLEARQLLNSPQASTAQLPPTLTGADSPASLTPIDTGSTQTLDIAQSPDGSRYVTTDASGKIQVIDTASGSRIQTLNVPSAVIMGCFSADGSVYGAVSNDKVFRVWKTSDWSLSKTVGLSGSPTYVEFSPKDPNIVAIADTARGSVLVNLQTGTQTVMSPGDLTLRFDPSGTSVYSTQQAQVHKYDIPSGQLKTIATNGSGNFSLDVSQDGKIVAAGDTGGHILFADATTGAAIASASIGTAVWSLRFDHVTKVLYAGGADGVVRSFDLTTLSAGHAPTQFPETFRMTNGGAVETLVISTHERTIAAVTPFGGSNLINRFAVPAGRWEGLPVPPATVSPPPTVEGLTTKITELQITQQAQVAQYNDARNQLKTLTDTLASLQAQLQSVTAQRDTLQQMAPTWPKAPAAVPSALGYLADPKTIDVAVSPKGDIVASASSDGTVAIYQASSGALLKRVAVNAGNLTYLAFDPTGSVLAVGEYAKQVAIVDVAAGTVKKTFPMPNFSAVPKFLDANHLAVVGADPGTDAVFNINDGTKVALPNGARSYSLAVSPDGKIVYAGEEGTVVKAYDAAAGTVLGSFAGLPGDLWYLAASADGQLLAATGSSGKVTICDAKTRLAIQSIPLDGYGMTVEFSADSQVLVVASYSGNVTTYKRSGATFQLQSTTKMPGIAYAATPNTSGLYFAAGGSDATTRGIYAFALPGVSLPPDVQAKINALNADIANLTSQVSTQQSLVMTQAPVIQAKLNDLSPRITDFNNAIADLQVQLAGLKGEPVSAIPNRLISVEQTIAVAEGTSKNILTLEDTIGRLKSRQAFLQNLQNYQNAIQLADTQSQLAVLGQSLDQLTSLLADATYIAKRAGTLINDDGTPDPSIITDGMRLDQPSLDDMAALQALPSALATAELLLSQAKAISEVVPSGGVSTVNGVPQQKALLPMLGGIATMSAYRATNARGTELSVGVPAIIDPNAVNTIGPVSYSFKLVGSTIVYQYQNLASGWQLQVIPSWSKDGALKSFDLPGGSGSISIPTTQHFDGGNFTTGHFILHHSTADFHVEIPTMLVVLRTNGGTEIAAGATDCSGSLTLPTIPKSVLNTNFPADTMTFQGGIGTVDLTGSQSLVTAVSGNAYIVSNFDSMEVTVTPYRGETALPSVLVNPNGSFRVEDSQGITSLMIYDAKTRKESIAVTQLKAEGIQNAPKPPALTVSPGTMSTLAQKTMPAIDYFSPPVYTVPHNVTGMADRLYTDDGFLISADPNLYIRHTINGANTIYDTSNPRIASLVYYDANGRAQPYPSSAYEIDGNNLILYPTGESKPHPLAIRYYGYSMSFATSSPTRANLLPPPGANLTFQQQGYTSISKLEWGGAININDSAHFHGEIRSFTIIGNVTNTGLTAADITRVDVHLGANGDKSDPITHSIDAPQHVNPGMLLGLRIPIELPDSLSDVYYSVDATLTDGTHVTIIPKSQSMPPIEATNDPGTRSNASLARLASNLLSHPAKGHPWSASTTTLLNNIVKQARDGAIDSALLAAIGMAPETSLQLNIADLIAALGLKDDIINTYMAKGHNVKLARSLAENDVRNIESHFDQYAKQFGIVFTGTKDQMVQVLGAIKGSYQQQTASAKASNGSGNGTTSAQQDQVQWTGVGAEDDSTSINTSTDPEIKRQIALIMNSLHLPVSGTPSSWYVQEGSPQHTGLEKYAVDLNLEGSVNVDLGKPVMAMAPGVIVDVDESQGRVILRHDIPDPVGGGTIGFLIEYLHLQNIRSDLLGTPLLAGQQIGEIGKVGGTLTAELHVNAMVNMTDQDGNDHSVSLDLRPWLLSTGIRILPATAESLRNVGGEPTLMQINLNQYQSLGFVKVLNPSAGIVKTSINGTQRYYSNALVPYTNDVPNFTVKPAVPLESLVGSFTMGNVRSFLETLNYELSHFDEQWDSFQAISNSLAAEYWQEYQNPSTTLVRKAELADGIAFMKFLNGVAEAGKFCTPNSNAEIAVQAALWLTGEMVGKFAGAFVLRQIEQIAPVSTAIKYVMAVFDRINNIPSTDVSALLRKLASAIGKRTASQSVASVVDAEAEVILANSAKKAAIRSAAETIDYGVNAVRSARIVDNILSIEFTGVPLTSETVSAAVTEGGVIRRVNLVSEKDPTWGLTKKHVKKHFFSGKRYALQQVDPGGNGEIWARYLQDLLNSPFNGVSDLGMPEVYKTYPRSDGSGSFRMGLRLAPNPDGTYDLITVLTNQSKM